jgi:hypothetical protein
VNVEPRIDESARSGVEGEPSFFAAGSPALGEFRCADCGYGVVVRLVLPACPMCRGVAWEDAATTAWGTSRV